MASGSGSDRPDGDPDEEVPGQQLDPEARAERLLVPQQEPHSARGVGRRAVPRPDDRGRLDQSARPSDELSRWIAALVGVLTGLDPDAAAVIAIGLVGDPVRERATYAELVAATEPVDDVWYAPDTRSGPVVLTVRSDPDGDAYTFSESPAHPIVDTRPV